MNATGRTPYADALHRIRSLRRQFGTAQLLELVGEVLHDDYDVTHEAATEIYWTLDRLAQRAGRSEE